MINLDLTGRIPIYEQICKGLSELIAQGILKENDKLPGARTLAKQLSLNPNTVAKAYNRMELDGIIYSVSGKGCFVAKQKGSIERLTIKSQALKDKNIEFFLGETNLKNGMTKRAFNQCSKTVLKLKKLSRLDVCLP